MADPSLRDKEVGRFKSAVARCFSQLEDIGVKSPRFLKVEEARRDGNMGAISLQENAFIGRFSSHKFLDCARRNSEASIISCTGLQKDPFNLTDWDVAVWRLPREQVDLVALFGP